MEFHDLGRHCSQDDCGRQDFLPFVCNACDGTFCLEHRSHAAHSCTMVGRMDKRVPVCPICTKPVNIAPGVDVNTAVDWHIASGCTKGVRQRRSNKLRCSARGCRGSEFVKISCPTCYQNFCFKHRHEQDHNCQGWKPTSPKERKQGPRAVAIAQHGGGNTCSREETVSTAGGQSSKGKGKKAGQGTGRGIVISVGG
ncbi:unnamed protein product [Choristocarpus tenellus]